MYFCLTRLAMDYMLPKFILGAKTNLYKLPVLFMDGLDQLVVSYPTYHGQQRYVPDA